MTILLWILGLLGFVYAIIDTALLHGLARLMRPRRRFVGTSAEDTAFPSVAILVCARNEEHNIAACLDSLLRQNYTGEWKIVVADDRSEDATAAILARYAAQYPERIQTIRIDELPSGLSPKKHALTQLHSVVNSEIVVLTDADCIVLPTWISGMASCFGTGVDWVSGYSEFPARGAYFSLLNGVQALDFLSHRTVDAAGVGLGAPITACGQNLAFRRVIFAELGGFEGVAGVVSGDDDLLMHKLAAKRPQAIRYATDPGTFVLSRGAETWSRAWEQRKRWASKTVHYNMQTVILLGSVFAFYLLLLCGGVLSLVAWLAGASPLWPIAFAMAWVWKTAWDALVTARGIRLFHAGHLWLWFVPTALLHIPMIVGAVLVGIFGKFTWKDSGTKRVAG